MEVELDSKNTEVPKPLRQGEAGVTPCFLNGVKGNLSITQSSTTSDDAKWYFTRLEDGDEIFISEPLELLTDASLHKRNGVLVLWTGTNDIPNNSEDNIINLLISQQRIMIDYLKHVDKKYIVIGLTNYIKFPIIEHINSELEKVYGKHLLDIT